ncbi:MAG: phytanoyl-CoA dioxygenase family protein [Abitibacteriaceae bacterium]|nr:phytanoyl-CoA dioxygenase family protein [Abditibacteriaceae bacterium]MBV9863791.1 phytanoyl-CoA dioxygenase family protein [Abditibacteriaceae bacterium]
MNWTPEPDTWRQQYDETGYLVVENAVEPGLLQQMREALERIECAVAEDTLSPNLRRWISLERDRAKWVQDVQSDSNAISNIMELPLFGAVFQQLIVYPRVLDILEALFQSTEFAFHNYKCICKMPGGNAAFQWHRDLPYLQHTSPNLLTCMLCIDPMTAENGATVVCPGSHRIPHDEVKDSDTDMPASQVPENRVTVTCPAGSAVVFHVNLIHGGPPNQTQSKRRNVIGIWSGPDAYPTNPHRYVYQGVMPRSTDPIRQKQIQMTFGE